ncbi:MAG: coenzyme F420-0:L-glutamate ligase [Ignavibacteriae bacterium]|nr:coenzyme F420-0:L-glutamate ligase [Ignavibacteriota bacterium]
MSAISSGNFAYYSGPVSMIGLKNFPIVKPGDDLSELICTHIEKGMLHLQDGDIFVVAQKIVSVAENALVDLSAIEVKPEARELSERTGRDAPLCQAIINDSRQVLETKGKVIVTEHRLGFVNTSAGVDKSNVRGAEHAMVSLLPVDPDRSAAIIRDKILEVFKVKVAVIINDSFGDAYREGSRGVGIGIAGIEPIRKEKTTDLYGQPKSSWINRVDEIAGAASALMGQTDGVPIVIGRGFNYRVDENASIQSLLIPAPQKVVQQAEAAEQKEGEPPAKRPRK